MAGSFLRVTQDEKQGMDRVAVPSGVGLCGEAAI